MFVRHPSVVLIPLALAFVTADRSLSAPPQDALRQRWIGTHAGQPLTLEFYGDTMLVIDDRHGLNVRVTDDSIIAEGDTTLAVRYRLVMRYLVLETDGGALVTMSTQSVLGRPLIGRWLGELNTDPPAAAEVVVMERGVAQWKRVDGGPRMIGEWEREGRKVTFLWSDTTEWVGQYDPIGNAILFERTVNTAEGSIFRRVFR